MSGIIWLASYPKSGNTWFRVFLSNLLSASDNPVDINKLPLQNTVANARDNFDEIAGISAADLTLNEINSLRPRVYEKMVKESADTLYLKVHDPYINTINNEPLLSKKVTRAAIYFIRNPLDVVVSLANHNGSSIDQAIDTMSSHCESKFPTNHLTKQLWEQQLGWSEHVKSWMFSSHLKIHLMRYEDMLNSPESTFSAVSHFLGFDYSSDEIAQAIRFSSFKALQQQEREHGFKEATKLSSRFFHSGSTGKWREHLTEQQIQRISDEHHEMMQSFGYCK